MQLHNTCLHSCCMFVSQRTSLMWQNAADDVLRRRPTDSRRPDNYREISHKRTPFVGEMYTAMCRMWFWFDVNQFACIWTENNFYIFVPSDLDLWPLRPPIWSPSYSTAAVSWNVTCSVQLQDSTFVSPVDLAVPVTSSAVPPAQRTMTSLGNVPLASFSNDEVVVMTTAHTTTDDVSVNAVSDMSAAAAADEWIINPLTPTVAVWEKI